MIDKIENPTKPPVSFTQTVKSLKAGEAFTAPIAERVKFLNAARLLGVELKTRKADDENVTIWVIKDIDGNSI